jgi:glycosyltransferase involved in cell wall biosynthesis
MRSPSADGLPVVSVIVPVLNGEQTIGACVAGLLSVDYPAERREILIVDNGSTDRTAEIVQAYPVRYLREDRPGAASARNRGIEASSGGILAFTDADCLATRRWLRELVAGFTDATIGAVEGEIADYPPVTLAQRYTARRRTFSYEARRVSPLAPYLLTGNVAFRREVFERIGLFDTRFPAAGSEDVDFSWRFFDLSGLETRYCPKAVVFHRHRATVLDLFRQQVRNGRGLAILRAKYPARLGWGWRQELRAWEIVAKFGLGAARAAVPGARRGRDEVDRYYPWITFVRKLGLRLGFVGGLLARRRP